MTPQLSASELGAALTELRVDPCEMAEELQISERTVRRWLSAGVKGPAAAAIKAFLMLDRNHCAWRRHQVTIRLVADDSGAPAFVTV